MSKRDPLVKGFDYREQKAVEHPISHWQSMLEAERARGGFEKKYAGDLHVFNEKGQLQFEVYALSHQYRQLH